MFLNPNVSIQGIKNITTKGCLEIGLSFVGFVDRRDYSTINIGGKLIFAGDYTIAGGCRFDIGNNATVRIGKGGYINSFTKMIIQHGLTIGDNCVISWDCQFLDEDFHDLSFNDKKKKSKQITIGNNVWIGCGSKVYKGSKIADGCVVASDSIVKGQFLTENVLIAGNPARVVKDDVSWS